VQTQYPRYLLILATLLALWLAFDLFFDKAGTDNGGDVRTEFLGTWTDERGKPGNSIEFSTVPVTLPNNYTGLELHEGRATF
jgi:hypothetical protein